MSSENKINQRYHLDTNAMMIASKYFETIEDIMNVELSSPKFKGNIDQFDFNPIELKRNTKRFFPNIHTLHLFSKYNDRCYTDKNITKRIIWHEVTFDEFIRLRKENEKYKRICYSKSDQKTDCSIPPEVNELGEFCFHSISSTLIGITMDEIFVL